MRISTKTLLCAYRQSSPTPPLHLVIFLTRNDGGKISWWTTLAIFSRCSSFLPPLFERLPLTSFSYFLAAGYSLTAREAVGPHPSPAGTTLGSTRPLLQLFSLTAAIPASRPRSCSFSPHPSYPNKHPHFISFARRSPRRLPPLGDFPPIPPLLCLSPPSTATPPPIYLPLYRMSPLSGRLVWRVAPCASRPAINDFPPTLYTDPFH